MEKETVTIKRYQNGKFYNNTISQYVQLNDILNLSKSGNNVTVIDNKSKKDITNPVLALAQFKAEFPGFLIK